jgi:hypothetical protein
MTKESSVLFHLRAHVVAAQAQVGMVAQAQVRTGAQVEAAQVVAQVQRVDQLVAHQAVEVEVEVEAEAEAGMAEDSTTRKMTHFLVILYPQ